MTTRTIRPEVITDRPADEQPYEYEWMGQATRGEQEVHDLLLGQRRFRLLLDGSMDLTCLVQVDGFIKYASASAVRILGIEAGYLAGRYLYDIFEPEVEGTPYPMRQPLRQWLLSDKLVAVCARHRDGHRVYLEMAVTDLTQDPDIGGFVVSARDVTARRLAEQQLQYQRRVLSNIREAVIGLDGGERITYLNHAAERLYRVRMDQVVGQHQTSLYQLEWLSPGEEQYMRDALLEHGMWVGEVVQITRLGRRHNVEVSVTAHRTAPGLDPSIIIVVRDIRDRKVVERTLHESENRFRSLVNVTSDLVWQTDDKGELVYISPKVIELLGFTAGELIGKPLYRIIKEGVNGGREEIEKALMGGLAFNYLPSVIIDSSGQARHFELSATPILLPQGLPGGHQGVMRENTQRIAAELALRQSLKDKETLIKEIHHRVKNNMQIVSSLLFLQSQFIQDPEMLSRLSESQDRIRSMALVHEKLYQSQDLSSIDFEDYIQTLTNHISNSYRNRQVNVLLELEGEHSEIGIDTAIPCGLIINELVSNAYKHAFPDGRAGRIVLGYSASGGLGVLTVSDTGIGLPVPDLSYYEETSLGSQLVLALVNQLQGSLSLEINGGTHVTVSFPLTLHQTSA